MKRQIAKMSVEELVARFVEIGVAQDRALLEDRVSTYNRLYAENENILEALKAMPGDQRSVLLALFDHPTIQVRLNATHATLAVAPEAARRSLEAIAASQYFPQAGDAGMSLWNLDRGIYKPD